MQKKALLNCSPAEVRLAVELFDGVRGLSDSLELDESASNHLAVGLLQDVDVDYVAALEKMYKAWYVHAVHGAFIKNHLALKVRLEGLGGSLEGQVPDDESGLFGFGRRPVKFALFLDTTREALFIFVV